MKIVHLRSYSFIPHEGVFEVRRVSIAEFVEALKGSTIKVGIRHKETFEYIRSITHLPYLKNTYDNINLKDKNQRLFAIRKEGNNEFVIWEITCKEK